MLNYNKLRYPRISSKRTLKRWPVLDFCCSCYHSIFVRWMRRQCNWTVFANSCTRVLLVRSFVWWHCYCCCWNCVCAPIHSGLMVCFDPSRLRTMIHPRLQWERTHRLSFCRCHLNHRIRCRCHLECNYYRSECQWNCRPQIPSRSPVLQGPRWKLVLQLVCICMEHGI